jgi:hypothetical protein
MNFQSDPKYWAKFWAPKRYCRSCFKETRNTEQGTAELMMFSISGELIMQKEFAGETQLNVQHLDKGVYVITITTYGQNIVKRLIIN